MNKYNLPTEELLAHIRKRFYAPPTQYPLFHRDRRMLLYSITWPAQWMDQRGLPITAQTYQKLLTQRIEDIAKHGEPARYQAYFPRYLLKCIQDWFAHHGDDLYNELKHVRNQLCGIEALLRQQPNQSADDLASPIAAAHAVLARQNQRKNKPNAKQLKLL
jgi:hypothetical protein